VSNNVLPRSGGFDFAAEAVKARSEMSASRRAVDQAIGR
jgi:hypothetical protein